MNRDAARYDDCPFARGWALEIRRRGYEPWLAGRYCVSFEDPPHLHALRTATWATRREAREQAKKWRGPEGEYAVPVKVRVRIVIEAGR